LIYGKEFLCSSVSFHNITLVSASFGWLAPSKPFWKYQ